MSIILQKCFAKREKINHFGLLPEIVCAAYLVADSPKHAFYRIWIEGGAGIYSVRKESGVEGRVLDKRTWPQENLDEARKLFERRIRTKTNPQRKCPRKYTMVYRI